MRKYFLLFLISCIFISGCSYWSPSKKLERAQASVTKVETKIDQNNDEVINRTKGYIYATDYTLSLNTESNKLIDTAKEFSSRAVLTLGVPSLDEAIYYRSVANNLLSSNTTLIVQGKAQLALKDKQIINLQSELTNLNKQLDEKDNKYKQVAKAAAAMGDVFYRIKYYALWIGGVFIGMFLLSMFSSLLPVPYNSISSLIALPLGLIFKGIHTLIPSVKTFAGVVHQDYKTATEDLITTIDKIKKNNPDIHQEISDAVYNNTDSTTSAKVINQTKQDLGMVS